MFKSSAPVNNIDRFMHFVSLTAHGHGGSAVQTSKWNISSENKGNLPNRRNHPDRRMCSPMGWASTVRKSGRPGKLSPALRWPAPCREKHAPPVPSRPPRRDTSPCSRYYSNRPLQAENVIHSNRQCYTVTLGSRKFLHSLRNDRAT